MDLFALGLGAGGATGAERMLRRFKEHRSEPAGLSDLLNWGFLVDDGVILQKDGSLLAAFRFAGPDLNAATVAELNALTRHVNDALLPFGGEWMFHVDAVRRPAVAYPASQFPDSVTQLIDEERRAAYRSHSSQCFETEYVWSITHLPPAELFGQLTRLFVQPGDDRPARRRKTDSPGAAWSRLLGDFLVALETIEMRLGARLRFERVDSDALVTHLHECLTGRAHPVRAPAHGSYLNFILADQELVGGFAPRVGDRAIRAVAIQGYPHASSAGGLDLLNTLPYAFRWSNRVIPVGTHAAARLIRRHHS